MLWYVKIILLYLIIITEAKINVKVGSYKSKIKIIVGDSKTLSTFSSLCYYNQDKDYAFVLKILEVTFP